MIVFHALLSMGLTVLAAHQFADRKWRIGAVSAYLAISFFADVILRVTGVF